MHCYLIWSILSLIIALEKDAPVRCETTYTSFCGYNKWVYQQRSSIPENPGGCHVADRPRQTVQSRLR
jgi:hypothetical protein